MIKYSLLFKKKMKCCELETALSIKGLMFLPLKCKCSSLECFKICEERLWNCHYPVIAVAPHRSGCKGGGGELNLYVCPRALPAELRLEASLQTLGDGRFGSKGRESVLQGQIREKNLKQVQRSTANGWLNEDQCKKIVTLLRATLDLFGVGLILEGLSNSRKELKGKTLSLEWEVKGEKRSMSL
jgi:hypothetical protein